MQREVVGLDHARHVNQTCNLIALKLSDPSQRADCAWCIIRCRYQARTAGHPAKPLNSLTLLEGLLTYVYLSLKEGLLRGRFHFANTRRQLQRDSGVRGVVRER